MTRPYTKHRRILALLLACCLTASASAQGRVGSIYNPDFGPLSVAGDKTARRTGDLVTVLISETQDLKNEEKSDLSKASDLNYQLLNFDVKPDAFNTLPSIQTNRGDNFAGQAKYEKKGNFTARLTAIVMDTLPNGNLVIQGRREIRIDGETKVIEFSGIVRRYDVQKNNTIESELVADARVSYSGSGPMTRSTNRVGASKWLYEAIDWIWPF
ncbi:MAG: flagellar basal body L-ring protein FlgH [bacterium]|nr:flagellar basal body L-ring protein FlgH [bacterium]